MRVNPDSGVTLASQDRTLSPALAGVARTTRDNPPGTPAAGNEEATMAASLHVLAPAGGLANRDAEAADTAPAQVVRAGRIEQSHLRCTALGLSRAAEVQGDVDAFVAEQEAKFGGEPKGRWEDYELLQLFDRLSLYFCMRDGEEAELQGYRIEPVAPWHVRLSPYPFEAGAAGFSLLRRVIPKNGHADVLGTPPERVEISVEP